MLESLAIKIYETDTTKILRSLAHGIDACASYEGPNFVIHTLGWETVFSSIDNIFRCYFILTIDYLSVNLCKLFKFDFLRSNFSSDKEL